MHQPLWGPCRAWSLADYPATAMVHLHTRIYSLCTQYKPVGLPTPVKPGESLSNFFLWQLFGGLLRTQEARQRAGICAAGNCKIQLNPWCGSGTILVPSPARDLRSPVVDLGPITTRPRSYWPTSTRGLAIYFFTPRQFLPLTQTPHESEPCQSSRCPPSYGHFTPPKYSRRAASSATFCASYQDNR